MGRYDNIPDAKREVYRNLSKLYRGGALSVFAEIIQQSPVGNPDLWKSGRKPKGYIGGTFRGNWQASVNEPIKTILADAQAVNREEDPAQAIGTVTLNDTLYLTNNLPYAQAIEEGHSTQRPSGWVRTIVAQGQSELKRRASSLLGG